MSRAQVQYRGPGAGLAAVGMKSIDQGVTGLQGALNSYENRIKNRAINELMQVAPTDGQKALDYSNQQRVGLAGISGVDPLVALNLANAQSDPYFKNEANTQAQSNADRLFGLNENKLAETSRHNIATESKTTPKGYGMISDDLGNFYQYNKDNGEYQLVQNASDNINPNNVSLKPVTSRNASGVETTNYVPFNKMTGQPINDAAGTATKYPTIQNSDKTYRDDMPVIDQNINNLESMINNPAYSSSFGQLDNAVDSATRWLGMQNKDSEKNAEISALSSNLLAGFGKAQMAVVLTDQDMKIIKQQIPSASDSPATAKKKLAFIKDLMSVRNKSWSDRMNQSNPGWLPEQQQQQNTPAPALEDLIPIGNGQYKMPDGTIIRRKAQ